MKQIHFSKKSKLPKIYFRSWWIRTECFSIQTGDICKRAENDANAKWISRCGGRAKRGIQGVIKVWVPGSKVEGYIV